MVGVGRRRRERLMHVRIVRQRVGIRKLLHHGHVGRLFLLRELPREEPRKQPGPLRVHGRERVRPRDHVVVVRDLVKAISGGHFSLIGRLRSG